MLEAAEHILKTEGIGALTLRRAAREAGASHAAPKNHFGDLAGLLSELAAVGFRRFSDAMLSEAETAPAGLARLRAIGRGYLRFARENSSLFLLMFRSDKLDPGNDALREAAGAAFRVLGGAVEARSGEAPSAAAGQLSLDNVAGIADAWSRVHGLAMLLIDGRLTPVLALAGATEDALIDRLYPKE